MKKLLLLLFIVVSLGLGHTQVSAMWEEKLLKIPYNEFRLSELTREQLRQLLIFFVQKQYTHLSIHNKIERLKDRIQEIDPTATLVRFEGQETLLSDLIKNHFSMSVVNHDGTELTPFNYALINWLEWLINRGAPVDVINPSDGTTALAQAIIVGTPTSVINTLRKHNADPNKKIPYNSGTTPLKIAQSLASGPDTDKNRFYTNIVQSLQINNSVPSVSSVATRRALSQNELESLILVIDHPELASIGHTFENAIKNIPNINTVNFNEYVERTNGQRINILAYALDENKWEYADAFFSLGDTDLTNTSKNEQGKLVTLTQTFNEKNLPRWHSTRDWFKKNGLALTPELPLEQSQQDRALVGDTEPLSSATENENRTDTMPQPSPVAAPHDARGATATTPTPTIISTASPASTATTPPLLAAAPPATPTQQGSPSTPSTHTTQTAASTPYNLFQKLKTREGLAGLASVVAVYSGYRWFTSSQKAKIENNVLINNTGTNVYVMTKKGISVEPLQDGTFLLPDTGTITISLANKQGVGKAIDLDEYTDKRTAHYLNIIVTKRRWVPGWLSAWVSPLTYSIGWAEKKQETPEQ